MVLYKMVFEGSKLATGGRSAAFSMKLLLCILLVAKARAFGVGPGLPMLRTGRSTSPRGPWCAAQKPKKTRAEKVAVSRVVMSRGGGKGGGTPGSIDMSRHIGVNLGHRGLKLVHSDPPIFTVDGFFTPEECDRYLSAGPDGEKSGASYQVASATFGGAATASNRRSTTWYLRYDSAVELVQGAMRLLPDMTLEQCEEPQIVRYEMGDFFSWHEDKVPPEQCANGGQRVATLLVYLNDVKKSGGGATQFKDLPVQVTPKKGTALLFFPAFSDGQPDSRTVHAGAPCMDQKWIAQMWVHQSAYRPVVPPGNSHELVKPLL